MGLARSAAPLAVNSMPCRRFPFVAWLGWSRISRDHLYFQISISQSPHALSLPCQKNTDSGELYAGEERVWGLTWYKSSSTSTTTSSSTRFRILQSLASSPHRSIPHLSQYNSMLYSTESIQKKLHLFPVAGELVLQKGPAPARNPEAERILIIGGGVTGLTVNCLAASVLCTG